MDNDDCDYLLLPTHGGGNFLDGNDDCLLYLMMNEAIVVLIKLVNSSWMCGNKITISVQIIVFIIQSGAN